MYRVLSSLFVTPFVFTLAILLSIVGVGGVESSSPKAGICVIAVAMALFYWLYRQLVQDMHRRRR
ncbi:MAG: hypothetical protein EOP36_19080 [Rubrivivax sp.]|nr:MAG: hypothetical protein EOP36_19080 [Rubrivivax sp.]